MKLKLLNTGYYKVDGGTAFGVVPKKIWQKLIPPDDNNLIPMAMRTLLIEDDNKLILIDAGAGIKDDPKYLKIFQFYEQQPLTELIKNAGYSPNDITDIILTHLHHDHAGGIVEKINNDYQISFPNANIWISQEQYQNALNPNLREAPAYLPQNIIPLKQHPAKELIKSDTYFSQNIYLKLHYGHTKGLISVHINYQNKLIVFASDFLPTQFHIYEPYIMSYDMCQEITLKEKLEFFSWITEKEHCIIFVHDPFAECGKIIKSEKGHKVGETFTLDEFISN